MKLRLRFPHLRSAKFVFFAIFSLFFLTNLTGVLFSPAFAPSAYIGEQLPLTLNTSLSGDHELDKIIVNAAAREGVDPRFISAVIQQESQYDPRAKSPKGARGLMQLMPGTAKRFDCDDVADEACNVAAGTKYLAWLLKRFDGDVRLALAG